jgi:hypothetical protein
MVKTKMVSTNSLKRITRSENRSQGNFNVKLEELATCDDFAVKLIAREGTVCVNLFSDQILNELSKGQTN